MSVQQNSSRNSNNSECVSLDAEKKEKITQKYKKFPWHYDSNYWSRDLVGISMEQINVNHLSSKKRIANKYDSVTLYGICENPSKSELSLDESLHRKKRRKEYWENIAKIAKELDLQTSKLNPSKNLKLTINEVVLTKDFSTKWWKNTIKNYHRTQYTNQVEQLPNYCDSDDEQE